MSGVRRRVDDPAGRLDVLALRLAERHVAHQANPGLTAWFEQARPLLEEFLGDMLGGVDLSGFVGRVEQAGRMVQAAQGGRV